MSVLLAGRGHSRLLCRSIYTTSPCVYFCIDAISSSPFPWQLSAAINKIWQNLALTLQFCHRLAEPYLAKGRRPSGHPAPYPSKMDTAGASPYAYDTPCWRIVCHRLPRRTSSDGASRRPRSHHRQQSIPMVCPAAAVSGWTATASYRRASWGCRTPKPLRWGLAPRPLLVGGAQAPIKVIVDYIVVR